MSWKEATSAPKEKEAEKETKNDAKKYPEKETDPEMEVDLGGTDGKNGTRVESHRGTKCESKTPKGTHKKWKGLNIGGKDDLTLQRNNWTKFHMQTPLHLRTNGSHWKSSTRCSGGDVV